MKAVEPHLLRVTWRVGEVPATGSRKVLSRVIAVLLLLPTVVVSIRRRGRVDLSILIALPMGQWLAGAYQSDAPGAQSALLITSLGCLVLLLPALPALRLPQEPRPPPVLRDQWHRLRAPVTLLVLGWTAIHFARAGVPILSGNVETDRFDLAASGLFGVPSRFFLFVLPMAAVWAGVATSRITKDRYALMLWAALVASRLAGGTKSGLLEVATFALVVAVYRHGPLAFLQFLKGRSVFVITATIVGAGLVAQTYGTVQARSDSTADYLIERLTVGTVGAAAHALERRPFVRSPIADDLAFYSPKYVGLVPRGFSASREIVASYNGVRVETGAVTTAVTLGLPIELVLTGGLVLMVAGCLAAGVAMRSLQRTLLRQVSWRSGAVGVAIVTLSHIIGNGTLVYYTLNFLGSVVLFAISISVARFFASTAARRQRGDRSRWVVQPRRSSDASSRT